MGHRIARQNTAAIGDWTYSESIDAASSTIHVRGRVDRLGVDLLRGTIEGLSRRGHEEITVKIGHRGTVDHVARAVLAETAARLAGRDGRLTIYWAADGDDVPRELTGRCDEAEVGPPRAEAGAEDWTNTRRLAPSADQQ